MLRGFLRAVRFQRGWKTRAPEVEASEVEVPCPGGTVPATLFRPPGSTSELPGWVCLHGITRPGRNHPTLLRFVRALACSGSAVLLPEIREWTELDLAPERAGEVLDGSIRTLAERREVVGRRLGAIGFSFGAPQVLLAGANPELAPYLGAVVGFGSYAELERTLRFLFLGKHEWNGTRYAVDPDPYGRWVVTGNYLTRVADFSEADDVAQGLLRLARAAGDEQVGAWEDVYDSLKAELEQDVAPDRRPLFRALATSGAVDEAELPAVEMAKDLAEAATHISPILDFRERLDGIRVPVRLIHGRQDRLIPFTETLRLARSLSPGTDLKVFLTGMFSHSQRDAARALLWEARERIRFLYLMSEILGLL